MSATILQFGRMAVDREHLPNRVRELREARGWSQWQLGDMVGTQYTTIGRLETGARDLSFAWMRVLARALGVDIGQLLLPEDNRHGMTDGQLTMLTAMREGDPAAVDILVGLAERTIGYNQQRDPEAKTG